MKKKKIKTKERRAQIANAALTIIAQEGMKGLTIAALARKAHITNSNIYRHFKDKNAVIDEVIMALGMGLEKIIREADMMQGTPLEKLEAVFLRQAAFVKARPAIPRLIFSDEMLARRGESLRQLQKTFGNYFKYIQMLLEQAAGKKLIRFHINKESAARVFFGLIQSINMGGNAFIPGINVKEKELWQIYLQGILPR